MLLLLFPILVPLAYDPIATQLKAVLALFLISAGLVLLLVRGLRAPARPLAPPALSVPILGVLGAAALSLVGAANRHEGVIALYGHALLSLGLLSWMRKLLRDRQQVTILMMAVCVGASLAAGVGIIQYAVPQSFAGWGAGGAAIGTTGNPNFLGAYLVVSAPLAVGLALAAPTRLSRGLGLAALGMVTLGLLATRTRAAWLAYLGGLGTVALLCLARRVGRRAGRPAGEPHAHWGVALGGIVCLALALGVIGAAWRGDSVVRRFTSIFNRTDPSIVARLEWWRDALGMIRDSPLVGVGVGNFPSAFIRYIRVPERAAGWALYLEHLHNEPLAFAAELGAVGLSAACVFLVALGRLARRAATGREGGGDPLGMAAVGSLVAAGIDSLFFYTLHDLNSATTLWMAVGFLEALARQHAAPGVAHPAPLGPPQVKAREGKVGPALLRWGSLAMALILAAAWWGLAVRPGAAAYYTRKGLVAINAGQPAAAVTSLEAARAWDPRHGPAYFLLGQALRVQGRNDEAIQTYQHALRLNPNDIAALNSIGFLHRIAGRIGPAHEVFERALAINPYLATTHNNLGDVLLAEGNPTVAMVHFRRALELFPGHAPAANGLALALIQLDRFDEAEAWLRRAVEFDPGYAMAWLNLYKLRGLLENWGGAAEALAQALRLNPALEAEARRAEFFDRVWRVGVSRGTLPVRVR